VLLFQRIASPRWVQCRRAPLRSVPSRSIPFHSFGSQRTIGFEFQHDPCCTKLISNFARSTSSSWNDPEFPRSCSGSYREMNEFHAEGAELASMHAYMHAYLHTCMHTCMYIHYLPAPSTRPTCLCFRSDPEHRFRCVNSLGSNRASYTIHTISYQNNCFYGIHFIPFLRRPQTPRADSIEIEIAAF